MKNLISFLTCLIISASLFSACSNEDIDSQNEKNQLKSELIVSLENLNNDILLNNTKHKTRGFFSWKTCAIALADIRGALDGAKAGAALGAKVGLALGSPHTGAATFAFVGGCAVGAFDSYVAHQGFESSRAVTTPNSLEYAKVANICMSTISDDLTFIDESVVYSPTTTEKLVIDEEITGSVNLEEQYLNTGKIHNLILGVADGSMEIVEVENINNPAIVSVLDSPEFQGMYDDITYKKLNNIEIVRDPIEEKVMDLFCEVFEQYSTTCDDVAFIINKYIEILETSNELTETQLNSIKTGLATSLYSFNYWDKTLN